MKKPSAQGERMPELFSQDSWHDFLAEQDRVNQELRYRDPGDEGWVLVATLRGEGRDSPELFRVYEKKDQVTAIASDFLNARVADAAAATSADQYESGTAKGLQANHAKKWAATIALVHLFRKFPSGHHQILNLHAILISKFFSDLVLHDINRLIAGSGTPDNQGILAKEAGAAYESGLKNFLVSIGLRKKKGTKRQAAKSLSLPWEWLVLLRARQFVARHKRLPRQAWLIEQVQSDGVVYKDEKGRAGSKWREFFLKVGLDTLPP